MASLYIHIPFCKQQCNYCNFHFSTLLKNKEEVVKAISKELFLRKTEVRKPLKSIYFGGGTPSILSEGELGFIFETIYKNFPVEENAEISFEANPDDLSLNKIKELKKTPINRFSIGTQSFFDKDLRFMNRAHSAQEAEKSILAVQDAGFKNISIDLIYGSPSTNDKMWIENVEKTINLQIPHISAYALTVEPKTVLHNQIKKGKILGVNDAQQERQYEILINRLTEENYLNYEISNFGKANYFSVHNSSYWLGDNYVGVGPSAHSFDGEVRAWNVANNTQYIKSLLENKIPQEKEVLSEKDRLNELTMIGLRTSFGIDLNKIKAEFSPQLREIWWAEVERSLDKKLLVLERNKLYLDKKHRFFADGIASNLFIL